MPDPNVIADVSQTLRQVLTDGLTTLGPGPPAAEVHDLHGKILTSPARLTIFLYDVIEDPSARNRPPLRTYVLPDVKVSKPPMALLLRYMLTAWSGDRLTDQKILGRVLQVLYDGAILSGPQLSGGLAGTGEAIKLTLAPLSLEDRTRVWNAVQKTYRLSLAYEARVIQLDSTHDAMRRPVTSRRLAPALPEAAA